MKPKFVILGMALAVQLILVYIETLIPMPFGVPGMKWGLSNLMVVLLLYLYGAKEAATVNFLRILLSGLMFGGFSAIFFSLSGAACAFLGMLAAKKSRVLSVSGVSLIGGVLHNLGQLLVAALTVRTYGVLYFLPPLLIAGCATGFAIGVVADRLLPPLSGAISEKR